MKLIVIVALIGGSFFLSTTHSDDKIIWSSNRKLEWTDFEKTLSNISDEAAVTSSGIDYQQKPINDRASNVTICDIFYKKLSGKTLQTSYLTNEVLEHEQGHFDINEWYARIFRKQLHDGSYSSFNQFNKAFIKMGHNITKAALEEENKYDQETNFARDTAMQSKWNKYISEQLNTYSGYAKSEFVINFK